MRVERLGEKAVIVRDLPCEAFVAAKRLNEGDGGLEIEEAVASYETLGLYFPKPVEDLPSLEEKLDALLQGADLQADQPSRLIQIPACYELGEDIEDAARSLELSAEELIAFHLATEYCCYAVGFSPGFAYLGYLDERIARLPRLPSPRKRVEPGSVGITGKQTAVYPMATPGGWNLIALCPLQLVDVADNYFPIEAGDRVRFHRIDEGEFEKLRGERL